MRSLFFLALLFTFSKNVFAQSATITGKVINNRSGQILSGATIILIEKSKTQSSDVDGNFNFNKLEAGTYSIKCSYAGYIEKIIEEIILKNQENITVSISLEEKTLGEVVLTSRSKAKVETVASLLIAQKNSASVSDGISAESIKKTPDRSTSDVIKRISGASIQDDRFVLIRGLNDRYNTSFINGAPLPSTESDRKAFSFDILPSILLDNLIIYKTATPDKSAEFAGGIIDITTKSIPSKNFTSVLFGLSYNSLSTGNPRYLSHNNGSKDWLGKDDGTRGIPSTLPSTTEIKNSTFSQKAEYAKLFGNYKWGIKEDKAAPNFNFQVSLGLNFQRKGNDFLGALFSIIYYSNNTFNEGERNNISPNSKYKDSLYNNEVVWAALGNISVKINNRNTITWKNNLSTNTDNRLVRRTGYPDIDSDPDRITREAVRWYTSNQIFSTQLMGEHLIASTKTKITWLGAYCKVDRDLPNYSRTSYNGDSSTLGSAFIPSIPNQLLGSGSMFFTSTNENIKSIKADISQPFTFLKNSQNFVKVGAGYQFRDRDFTSRVLGFAPYNQGTVQFDYSLNQLPENEIFLPEHLGKMANGLGGFLLQDGSTPNSNYTASSAITHAYLMSDQRFFKKFRLIYGVRMENFNQKLNSPSGFANLPPILIDSTVTDILPSLNLVYALTPKMNLRASYAKTLNRPEFRELAPFVFYDYQAQYSISGSVNLQRAKITNYDFRYEFYPGKAQLFSLSAFYKNFTNPIEIIFVPGIAGQAAYTNSRSAVIYGFEAEFRTLLSTILGINREKSFLNRLTISANGAYIESDVKLAFVAGAIDSSSRIATSRPMQGQSPYVINVSVGYTHEKTGITSTLSINKVGDRLSVAGTKGESSDLYEKARTVVDFQVAKLLLNNKLELKFNIKDILAQNSSIYFDNDKSKTFSVSDTYFGTYKAPTIFSFSASYKF